MTPKEKKCAKFEDLTEDLTYLISNHRHLGGDLYFIAISYLVNMAYGDIVAEPQTVKELIDKAVEFGTLSHKETNAHSE